jgi:hypothetical protein
MRGDYQNVPGTQRLASRGGGAKMRDLHAKCVTFTHFWIARNAVFRVFLRKTRMAQQVLMIWQNQIDGTDAFIKSARPVDQKNKNLKNI